MSNFMFAGVDTVELAKKYKTPLYVMSEDYIVDRCREIREDFLEAYPNTMAVYASKAFLTKEMARIINREGIGMDVVSGGELYTALAVDFPMENIIFHGNNKSYDEIKMAIENNVGRIVVDSIDEIDLVNQVGSELNKRAGVLFRISPGIESDTHKYIQTGQVDSKFGIPLTESTMNMAMEKALNSPFVDLKGFHFHIGSQILENKTHLKALDIIVELMKKVKREFDFDTVELNTGGGYGIHYIDGDVRKPLKHFTDAIMEELSLKVKENNLLMPKVIIEPGRWTVGEAGITLYEIGNIKEIPGIRTYVSVDGGLPDNPRPALYEAEYKALIANKFGEPVDKEVTIAGKCCESGDILIWDLGLPKAERGDILAVMATGAYNYSMASNYNRLPKPAVVMIKDGVDRLIVKRETYEDVLRNDL